MTPTRTIPLAVLALALGCTRKPQPEVATPAAPAVEVAAPAVPVPPVAPKPSVPTPPSAPELVRLPNDLGGREVAKALQPKPPAPLPPPSLALRPEEITIPGASEEFAPRPVHPGAAPAPANGAKHAKPVATLDPISAGPNFAAPPEPAPVPGVSATPVVPGELTPRKIEPWRLPPTVEPLAPLPVPEMKPAAKAGPVADPAAFLMTLRVALAPLTPPVFRPTSVLPPRKLVPKFDVAKPFEDAAGALAPVAGPATIRAAPVVREK